MSIDRPFVQLAILTALWAIITFGTISTSAMLDDADTVHAEAVREMVHTGDWVTLKINNGVRYLEKAPLMYWLSAASASVFGVKDWAVRLPVALFGLFLAFLLVRFGNHFWGGRAGFYSGLVFITALGPFAFTRILIPDVILAFFIALAFYGYLRVSFDPEPPRKLLGRFDPRCMLIYVAAALAVLTKGLVGPIFIGAVIFVHLLLTGRWEVLKRLQVLPGLVLFLIIAAPWHLAAGFANKGFFWFYFMNEHFLRYLGLRYPKDYDTVPLYLFWTLHVVWLFPWTAFCWGLGRLFPRTRNPQTPQDSVRLFLFVWILTILVFFSFSTTQEYYTFPTLPAFALLFGLVLNRLDSPEGAADRGKALWGTGILAGIGLLVGGAMTWLATAGAGTGAESAEITGTLTVNPEQYALSFGHVHDLTPATFAYLAPLVLRTAAVIALGPLLAFLFGLAKKWRVAIFCLALMMTWLMQSYAQGMKAFEPVLSSRGLARVVEYYYRPGDRVVVNGVYERGSSINYYTGIQLSVLNGFFGNLWRGAFFPDAPQIYLDDREFLDIWNTRNQRIIFFTEEEPFQAFIKRTPGFDYRTLAEEGGKRLLVNW